LQKDHQPNFLTLEHRFPTFSEAGTPFIKIMWRLHPSFWKKRRNHKNSPILQYLYFYNYYSQYVVLLTTQQKTLSRAFSYLTAH